MRHVPASTCLLVAALSTGCAVPRAAIAPSGRPFFGLAAEVAAPPTQVAIAGASAARGTLTVDVSAFVATFGGSRRLLAAGDDLDTVVVTVSAPDGGAAMRQALDRDALAHGRTAVRFDGVTSGPVEILAEALDAGSRLLGYSVQHADVTAGVEPRVAHLAPASPPPGPAASPSPSGSAAPARPAEPRRHDASISYRPWGGSADRAPAFSCWQMAEAPNGDRWLLGTAVPLAELTPERLSVAASLVRLSPSGEVRSTLDAGPARAIAVDGQGRLWVARADRQLDRYDAAGRLLGTTTLTASPALRGLAVDAGGHAWLASGRSLGRYDTSGRPMETHGLSGAAGAVCADAASGGVWAISGNQLVRFTAEGAAAVTSDPVSAEALGPLAPLAADAEGRAWVGLPGARRVSAVSPNGAIATTTPLDGAPTALATGPAGEVWAALGEAALVVRLRADGAPSDLYRMDEPIDALSHHAGGPVWAGGAHVSVLGY